MESWQRETLDCRSKDRSPHPSKHELNVPSVKEKMKVRNALFPASPSFRAFWHTHPPYSWPWLGAPCLRCPGTVLGCPRNCYSSSSWNLRYPRSGRALSRVSLFPTPSFYPFFWFYIMSIPPSFGDSSLEPEKSLTSFPSGPSRNFSEISLTERLPSPLQRIEKLTNFPF